MKQKTKGKTITERKPVYVDYLNIYEVGKGNDVSAKINISINYETDDPNIHIQDSYQFTDIEDMMAIIDLIKGSPVYDEDILTRSDLSYMIEWDLHNRWYYNAPGDFLKSNAKSADLNCKGLLVAICDKIASYDY